MPSRPWRDALRFDGGFWRKFAELGCVYGPEWWKRASPPAIAAIIYAIAGRNRAVVRANQLRVLGPRSAMREHWDAYRVFASLARAMTEGMEQWGPHPKPLDLKIVHPELVEDALAEGRGLVAVTGHFGSWEVGARVLSNLGRPVQMVMADEANPTVREFLHSMRTRHGFNVIYSARSVFTGLPILQALRRHEIVGMQIEPWGPMPGTHQVVFCGQPTNFQLGPFAIARVAKAPVVAVFAVRTGVRRYELRVEGRWDPRTPGESANALEQASAAYERLVLAHPYQWLMFDEVWRVPAPAHVSTLRDRAPGLRVAP